MLVLPLLFGILFVALSVAASWAVRRRRAVESLDPMQEPLGGVFMSGIAGLYGVLLAFVLTAALGRLEQARQVVGDEIDDVIALAILSEAFPPGPRAQVLAECRAYFESLRREDPREVGTQVMPALQRLRSAILRFQPQDSGQSNAHAAALDRVTTLGEHRRSRLLLGRQTMPWPVWSILLFGGAFAMVLSAFARIDPPRLHLVFVAGLATLIGTALLSIYVLERPFSVGYPAWYQRYETTLHVGRQAMERSLDEARRRPPSP